MRTLLKPLALALLVLWVGQAFGDAVFPIRELYEAEDRAKDQGLAIAWVCSTSEIMARKNPRTGNSDELSQMVMSTLRQGDDSCVVIFVNGNSELHLLPRVVYDQMVTVDIPGDNQHFYIPKIVFTNQDASIVYGTVTFHQLHQERATALLNMLFHVARAMQRGSDPNDPTPQPVPIASDATPSPDANDGGETLDLPSSDSNSFTLPKNLWLVVIVVMAVTCAGGLFLYQFFHWLHPPNENPYSHSNQPLPNRHGKKEL